MIKSRLARSLLALYRRFNPIQQPLEKRLYKFLTLLGAISCLLIVLPTNLLQNDQWIQNLFVIFLGLFCLGLFTLNHLGGITLNSTFILVSVLVFDFLFLSSGGMDGGLSLYYILGILYSVILLRGWKRTVLGLFFLLNYPVMVLIGELHPELVVPFAHQGDHVIGHVTSFVIAGLLAGTLVWAVMSNFDMERYRVQKRTRSLKTLVHDLKNLAIKDGLTSVFNHKYLLDRLEEEGALARRHALPLTAILFDVDHFKLINDTYGHPTGDRVLLAITDGVRAILRKSDVFGRYGGEEFLVILCSTPLEGAKVVAEKIRRIIEGLTGLGIEQTVTVSLGLAEYHGETALEFLDRTDKFLYQAKRLGRNCWVAEPS